MNLKVLENHEETSVLEFILLSQFHEKDGKLIIGHYPQIIQNPLIQPIDLFTRFSDFLIPKQELCAQFMSILVGQYCLLTLPVILKNRQKDKTYNRANYIFGITICVQKQQYENDRLNYEQMIRKITYFFVILQMQKHILYHSHKQKSIQNVLKAVLRNTFTELNRTSQTMMNYKGKYFTFVSTCTSGKTQKIAKPYEVPLTVLTIKDIEAISHDPLKKIMRQVVYGQSCVKKISQELDIKLDEVLEYLNIGIRYQIIYMMDIFSLDNVYVLTKQIHSFARDKSRLNKIKQFLVKSLNTVQQQQILQMYLRLRRGKTIKDHIQKYPDLFSQISVVSFIRIGIIEGIVKRVKQILISKQVPSQIQKNIKFVDNEIYQQSFQYIKKKQQANYTSLITTSIQKINKSMNDFVKNNAEVDQVMVQFCITKQKVKQIVSRHGVEFLQVA